MKSQNSVSKIRNGSSGLPAMPSTNAWERSGQQHWKKSGLPGYELPSGRPGRDENFVESMQGPALELGMTRAFAGFIVVALLVFLSTLPVVLPFVFMHDAIRALPLSNAITIVMLFLTGYAFGRCAGHRPWVMGISMVVLGAVLVAISIAL
jgi:VIT1/CCC1 family predicted Fe2+/Mn2+ transporter